MHGMARVATICQNGQVGPTVEENVARMLAWLDDAIEARPDLICLPEAFVDSGTGRPLQETAESIPGPLVDALANRARAGRCYIIGAIHTRSADTVKNSAVVLDRSGAIAGVYHKVCPVTGSHDYTRFEAGITPGQELPVFDLDFGRIGIQICFDIGFPENWQALADADARLIVWPSAYDGGFPLRAYAYLHHLWVVSSVRSGRSRVIDPCGEIMAETSPGQSVLVHGLNLDFVVAHWDWNMGIAARIAERYGDRVAIRQWDPGSAHMMIEPRDPSVTTSALQEEFGFESTRVYHERHRTAYERIRAGEPPEPQAALHGDRPQWGQ